MLQTTLLSLSNPVSGRFVTKSIPVIDPALLLEPNVNRDRKSISKSIFIALFLPVFFLHIQTGQLQAEESASDERTQAAIGHYARARSLLVEALDEFESARKLARPDLLIDSEEWRISVISRTEELNRILDPQPRITRSGVRFQASNRQVSTPSSKNVNREGPRNSNTHGEDQRMLEVREAKLMPKPDSSNQSKKKGKTKPNEALTAEVEKTPEQFPPIDSSNEIEDRFPPETDNNAQSKVNKIDPDSAENTINTPGKAPQNQPEPPSAELEDPSVDSAIGKMVAEQARILQEKKQADAKKPKPANKKVEGLFKEYE